MNEVRADLPAEPAGPFDTHPATRGRVAHFESLRDDGVVDDGVPALGLLADSEGTLLRLEAEPVAEARCEPRAWDQIADADGAADSLRRHLGDRLVCA